MFHLMSFASTIFHQGAKSTTVLLFMASSTAKQVMAELKPSSMFVAGSAEYVFKNGYCSIIGNYKTCCHIRIYHFPLINIKRAFCLIFADDVHPVTSRKPNRKEKTRDLRLTYFTDSTNFIDTSFQLTLPILIRQKRIKRLTTNYSAK